MTHIRSLTSATLRSTLRRAALVALALGAVSLASCSDAVTTLEPTQAGQNLSIRAGQPFDIVLQTIGFGSFGSPPNITPDLVRYLDVEPDGEPNPGGPRQRFHFRAVAAGVAVITFVNSDSGRSVQDTITVHN